MNKPIRLKIFDKDFACTVCGHEEFTRDTFQITSGGLLARTRERPTVLVCTNCGYVHWFLPRRGSYPCPSETPPEAT